MNFTNQKKPTFPNQMMDPHKTELEKLDHLVILMASVELDEAALLLKVLPKVQRDFVLQSLRKLTKKQLEQISNSKTSVSEISLSLQPFFAAVENTNKIELLRNSLLTKTKINPVDMGDGRNSQKLSLLIRLSLETISENNLLSWFKEQTLSIQSMILTLSSPKIGSKLLKSVSGNTESLLRQVSVAKSIALNNLELLLSELEDLKKRSIQLNSRTHGGVNKVCEVMESLPKLQQQKLMESIKIRKPELYQSILKNTLTVAALTKLSPKELVFVLQPYTSEKLGLLLRNEDQETQMAALHCLSKSRKQEVEQLMLHGPKVPSSVLDALRLEILDYARHLEFSGKIVFKGAEEVVD